MMNKLYELVKGDWTIGLDMLNEVNSWDGSLSNSCVQLDYLYMEDFDNYLMHLTPMEIANKIHFGDFNPCHEYFGFDAYNNLVSYSEYDLEAEIINFRHEIVDRFVELYKDGHVETWSTEVKDILADMEEMEEE